MRYKAAAKKLKQVAELSDPTPADVVLQPTDNAFTSRDAVAKDASGGEAQRDYGADEKDVVVEATVEAGHMSFSGVWVDVMGYDFISLNF